MRALLTRMRAPLARRRFADARGLRLNLGAGGRVREGWTNVDLTAHAGIDCVYDLRRGLPFADESTDLIFCEHLLEHLDYVEEVPRFLDACWRALKPGGVLRIVVPDAEAYLRAYVSRDWPRLQSMRPLQNERVDRWTQDRYATAIELVNAVFRQHGEHRFAYDYETLEFALVAAGFRGVQRQAFGQSLDQRLAVDLPDRASESLYVDAQK